MLVLQWVQKGGPMMWPILAIGLVAIYLVVERSIVLFRMISTQSQFDGQVRRALAEGNFAQAANLCLYAKGLRPRMIQRFVEHEAMRPGGLELPAIHRQMVEAVQTEVIPRLQARLGILSTIGRVAPLLGLLGTVQGMIMMFFVAGKQGTGLSEGMAQGIGHALITTFAGLCIAIPVQFAEGIFESHIEAFLPKVQADMSLVLSHIREHRFMQQVIRISPVEVRK